MRPCFFNNVVCCGGKILLALICCSCNPSVKTGGYEHTDSAHGPRVNQQQMKIVRDTAKDYNGAVEDSSRDAVVPGSTDTTKLNIQ